MDLPGANPANNQGQIVESILRAQHTVLSVSSLVPEYYQVAEVHLSLPAVVSRSGVEWILHLPLDNTETTALRRSAAILRDRSTPSSVEDIITSSRTTSGLVFSIASHAWAPLAAVVTP